MNMQVTKPLNTINAVISGGASGLGLATATRIINAGGHVTLLDINQEQGEKSQQQLGDNALFVQTDVCSETAVNSAVDQANKQFGAVNLGVNCAGIAPSSRVLGKEGLMPMEDFSRVISINLTSTFCVTRALANVMQHNTESEDGERGVVVNTASIAAFDGQTGQAAYAASKAGIVGMMLPLAREFSRFGIRVMTIAPGVFHTPMFDTLPAKVVEMLEQSTPFPKRLGKPHEFAEMVCHIFQNTMLNGETIRLDGALRMS